MASRRFDVRFVERFLAKHAAESNRVDPPPASRTLHRSERKTGVFLCPSPEKPLRILGIDTSLRSTGIAILESDGRTERCLDLRPIRNPANRSLGECLVHIRKTLAEYIEQWNPDEAAMEGIFFLKNAKTSLILGHARGVVVETCAEHSLNPAEYSPTRVKKALTGGGSATKSDMQRMVMRLFSLPELPQEDAADALAIALAHLHARRFAALG